MKDKKCSNCNVSIFNTKMNKSGLCKKCRQREYYQRPEVKARIRRRSRERELTPDQKTKRRIWERGYMQKPAVKERKRNYNQRPEVKERRRNKMKKYNQKPKVKIRIKEYHKEYNKKPEVKERRKEYMKEYRQRPEVKIKRRKYQQRPEIKEYMKKYQKSQNMKDYRKKFRKTEKYKTKTNAYQKKRFKEDMNYRVRSLVRIRFWQVINKYTKAGKIMSSKKYGIDFKAIIEHLKPFPADTSLYHIDHIKPLSSFNFINEDGTQNLEEIKKAFKPSNHQWLLIKDNLVKSNKITKQSKLI